MNTLARHRETSRWPSTASVLGPSVAAALVVARGTIFTGTIVSFFLLWFLNPSAGRFAFAVLPLLALATVVRARAALVPWAVYIVGFLVFVDLRMISAEVLFPARFDYVIELERAMFFGAVPSVILQQAFYRLGTASVLDIGLIIVHFSFFLVPHAMAVWLWMWRRSLFSRYVVALVATCWIGLVTAFLVPTAPPWLAGAENRIPHVYRIMRDVLLRATPETYHAGVRVVGENDVAAMPSLHIALTVLVALAASRGGRTARVFGWSYVIVMALALVYLGEHYVIDLVAGAAMAVVVWRLLPEGRGTPH